MKTLKNILIGATILSSEIKEESTQALELGIKNILRKEEKFQPFEVGGKEINLSIKEDENSKITYSTKANKNIIYFSVRVEKKNKDKELPENQNYFRIMESSKLLVVYNNNAKITQIRQQGEFITQDFWKKEKIYLEKKGLIKLENHREANKIMSNSQILLDYLISKIPLGINEEYKEAIKKSEDKRKEKIRALLENFNGEANFELIPLYIPDKLIGQKMISIDYEISFDRKPKKVMFYAGLNLE